MNNPQAEALLQMLTPAQIRTFTQDQASQYIGLSLVLTPEGRQRCQYQLLLLQVRRSQLILEETKKALTQQQKILINYKDYKETKQCWKCFFLEVQRFSDLFRLLFLIFVVITTTSYTIETIQYQQDEFPLLLIAFWGLKIIGVILVMLLIAWGIGRRYYLAHPHRRKTKAE